jgi:hypothetical protein
MSGVLVALPQEDPACPGRMDQLLSTGQCCGSLGKAPALGLEPSGFEGLRAISVHAGRRQATLAEGHDVRVWQLDRHSARAAHGHDTHEHHYLVARVDRALGLKAPFGPGVPPS